jgi:hypothetical protein
MPQIGGTDVPSQYVSYVDKAAAATGLPAAVVAAQINEESGFQPGVTSSAGAEGIAQFEPGTFASYGTGSPYNVADAFAAYTAYMSALLKQFGGNISDALAAYNAGPDDLAAGAGYASTILSNSGSTATKAGKASSSSPLPGAGNPAGVATGSTTSPSGSTGSTPTTSGTPSSSGTSNQGQSAISGAGGWDPLSLLGDVTGLARDIATVIDYVFGMFGRGQAWRLVFTAVFGAAAYGAYRSLVATGAIPDLGKISTPSLAVA